MLIGLGSSERGHMPWAKASVACVCHHFALPLTVPGVTIYSSFGGGIGTQPHQQGKAYQRAMISRLFYVISKMPLCGGNITE